MSIIELTKTKVKKNEYVMTIIIKINSITAFYSHI